MNAFDTKRASDLKSRLIAKEGEIFPGIVGLPEELFELLVSNWGYFGAIDRVKELENYIVLNKAFKKIVFCEETGESEYTCNLECEKNLLDCPWLEDFKYQAREELEKEGVI
jgi:hypothetical protein